MAIAKPKKFGQILLEHGWVTKDQLQRALQNQSVVGGRIGTCLLEMDALPEDLVMKALAEQHGSPAATVENLRNIPEEIHKLLPARVARRCRAVPFQMVGTQVFIALLDVRNLQIQDELAFVTNKRLKVFVANEARIYEALEKYYGEECPQRFSHLIDRMNRARYLWDRPEEGRASAPASQSSRLASEAAATPRSITGTSSVASFTDAAKAAEPVTSEPAAAEPVVTEPVAAAATPEPAAVPASRPPTLSIPLAPEERAALRGAPAAPPTLTLRDIEIQLLNPKDRDDVGMTLLTYLNQDSSRVILFKALKNNVEGWMGRGAGVQADTLAAYSVPFNQPSVFLNLKQSGQYFLGTLAPMPSHRDLARTWGGEVPRESLVLPVRIKDRVAIFVYLDNGANGLSGLDMEGLQRLAAKAAIAFELCIMRSKLKQA